MKIKNQKPETQAYFVVGTDTGVGKTIVTALLALHFQVRGFDVGVMKPFASGSELSGGAQSDDATWLKMVTNSSDEMELINPARWQEPLTPLTAARRAYDDSDYWTRAQEALKILQARHEMMIVEGVGGLLAPIAERESRILSNADWASQLSLPVVLVARRTLGTINHTLLTVEVLRARNIEIAGLVFCDAQSVDENDIAAQTSPALIAEISQVNILGTMPFLQDLSLETLQKACRNFLAADSL